jgi:hypothetical protein
MSKKRAAAHRILLVSILVIAGASSAVAEGSQDVTSWFGGRDSVIGSGTVEEKELDLSGFDRVSVSHTFKVEIRQGRDYRVVVRADRNVAHHLEIVKRGSTLRIGLDNRVRTTGRLTLEATVTMPRLDKLEQSGVTEVSLSGFKSSSRLELVLSGASSLTGDVEAGNVDMELSGTSSVTLEGSGRNLAIDASGVSRANMGDFPVDDADIRLSGASVATVNPSAAWTCRRAAPRISCTAGNRGSGEWESPACPRSGESDGRRPQIRWRECRRTEAFAHGL